MENSLDHMFATLDMIQTEITKCHDYIRDNPDAIDVEFFVERIPELEGYAEHIQSGIEYALSSSEDNNGEQFPIFINLLISILELMIGTDYIMQEYTECEAVFLSATCTTNQ